ncbi:tetratricopeptide repeat protein [Microcoleus sp. S36b_A4]|uniref:tetratricopeptide repeat protein n=1 Tax=Microcoleus sp. S36b_A4 TaxID=3055420 RepID=UPI002FCFDD4F
MKSTYLSRFTPSLMTPEALEAILVKRQQLVQDLVERVRESAANSAKHYTLLIGPRGIGKTYLISLLYHRVCKLENLREKLVIAWLREEEWGVSSFLDVLLRIFPALENEYLKEYNAKLRATVEKLYQSPDTAESTAAKLVKEFVGNRTFLLIVENLDEIFSGLGEEGQKQFLAFIQELGKCTIVATSTSLFKGIKIKKSPFYGFFNIQELPELTLEEAAQLLKNIAEFEGKQELAAFIDTKKGFERIKVVHYLSGGSPRIYIILSAFLTRDSLDELRKAFMEMLDDLTPFYQEKIKILSNQQRKIVNFLCDRGGATPVKEISKFCFITQQTASSQLKDLRDKGYVKTEEIGRESWYELREPLMRFCLEVKQQQNQPIRLIINFLRFWYTRKELQQRLESRMDDFDFSDRESHAEDQQCSEPIPFDTLKDQEYYRLASEVKDIEWRKEALAALDKAIKLKPNSAWAWTKRGDVLDHLKRYEEFVASYNKASQIDPNDQWAWAKRGDVFNDLFKRYEEALECYDKVIEIDPNHQWAWVKRGDVLDHLKRYEEALVSYDKAIEVDPNSKWAWVKRGDLLNNLKCYEEALVCFDKAIELDANYQWAWRIRGNVLNNLKRHDEALASLDRALTLDGNYQWAWANRGNVLNNLKRYEEALESYDKASQLDPSDQWAWASRGYLLNNLKRYKEALASLDKAIEVDPHDAISWNNKGWCLLNLERYEEALVSFDKAIELDANFQLAWLSRGVLLNNLKRYDEALVSFDKAIELDANFQSAWAVRGDVLNNLKRYDETLASLDRAIELGDRSSYVFFKRAMAILGLNRWDEGIAALYDAFQRLEPSDEADAENAELITRNLFANTHDAGIWKNRITSLIAVYEKHEAISILGQAIVRNIPALMSEMVSDKAARTWLELWQELTSKYEEFQIPIRLLNAAVRYKETKGDRRVLLELAIEERNLLEPLVSTQPE